MLYLLTMLKKIIISAALMVSFSAAMIANPAKADSVFEDNDAQSSLIDLSAATSSLDVLTKTMNETVSAVSKVEKTQSVAKEVQSRADKLVSTAKKYMGVPYVWGGTTPAGFDCSGFTSYVYKEVLDKEIGRTTWDQIASGKQVALDQAKVGDLIIFYGGDHVGIYLGNGQVIHAPQPGESVKISSVTDMPADFALEY
ncbi:C40 family peptidase [Lactococcus cremoris]|uniref:C40 family peptidase n=1 Tax=Lactococcus lactis subsp. cremoris TaxID=1359 RepID=UPI0009C14F9B|nr:MULTISPECIES: C40 family peptidase [Lactococcus]ARE18093.2 C40 family peptidase [Lactococcus cremoris]ARE25788.1 C40 family peptidase [Lactococcus cremoris]MCT0458994.1 peptidoglycan endopeptidase [Lactococcus cremoris]MCT4415299.1 peptidoglycan endopeptidase [Lactococcus cremoris]MCT4416529.1 peptidoglycan endopeptidase [Lactococcus cremoris]